MTVAGWDSETKTQKALISLNTNNVNSIISGVKYHRFSYAKMKGNDFIMIKKLFACFICAVGIGGAGKGDYYSKIKCYSLRVYSRGLTEAELAQNWAADAERFGIT